MCFIRSWPAASEYVAGTGNERLLRPPFATCDPPEISRQPSSQRVPLASHECNPCVGLLYFATLHCTTLHLTFVGLQSRFGDQLLKSLTGLSPKRD